jgi:Flp pilus assembly protein TadB
MVAGWWLAAPALIVAGPIIVVAGAVEYRRWRTARSRLVAAAAAPVLVDRLILQLRAGNSLPRSCTLLAAEPGAWLVRPLTAASDHRTTLAESARELATSGHPATRLLGVTIAVLAENGGPAVPALQRLRHTLIGVANGRRRAESEAAQALASGRVLAVAPTLFAGLLAALDPSMARIYLRDGLGSVCVVGSLVLSWIGWLWIQRQLAAAGGAAA